MRNRWDRLDPDDAAERAGLRDPHLEPLFPIEPLTPKSKCPHHCGRCSGRGFLAGPIVGPPPPCPKCKGTGKGPVPKGDPFVCVCCDHSGKDHLLRGVSRPRAPRPAKTAATPRPTAPPPTQTRRQRRQARALATASPSF